MTPDLISTHFERMGYVLIPVELDLWDPTHTGERFHRDYHTRYGYTVPELVQTGGELAGYMSDGTPIRTQWERVFRFCPELIAIHLAGVDEGTSRRYLDSIVTHLRMHMAHEINNGEEFEDMVETTLESLDPAAYRKFLAIRAGASVSP